MELQSLRKRRVVNKDRISELPDALILQILSQLATKDVVSTSVLSKRWRSLWKMVHKLDFDSHNQATPKFIKNVARFLCSHEAPVLESFHLKVGRTDRTRRCDPTDIGIWIGILFARHVRELELNLSLAAPFRLTISLFTSNTLETLKLHRSVLVDVPYPVCMKSLRTLHLECVSYQDDQSVRNLLSSFPNLEHLVVQRGWHFSSAVNFNIVSPFLKTLSINGLTDERSSGGYVINAPSLRRLNISRLQWYKLCLIENASELVEASIRNVSNIDNEMILGSLKSAKRLSLGLSPLEIKCPTGVIFTQLLYLEMETHRKEWWNLLALMLNISPKLQVLKLINPQPVTLPVVKQSVKRLRCLNNQPKCVPEYWNQPNLVPESLLSHLETFLWTRYDWESRVEKEVATYILRNATQLKNATFSTRPIESKEVNKLEERCKMLKDLDCLTRASNSCNLVFKSE